jgi:anti-sigma B factor antagonist
MYVLVGERFACVKIVGRANFNSSIDFKTLIHALRQKGYRYFVLELAECQLMDSTFLGVLAGFGLKMTGADSAEGGIELLNPNPRITELLENLGVLHLFRVGHGEPNLPDDAQNLDPGPAANPSKAEVTRACLEAHETLMKINPKNISRFKDVAQFLADDLKRLNEAS